MKKIPIKNHSSEGGAALVIGLIILLVMTMLSLSSMTTSRMEYKMAGNNRDVYVSFQMSEAALIAAEKSLKATPTIDLLGRLGVVTGYSDTSNTPQADLYLDQNAAWWQTVGVEYVPPTTASNGVETASNPRYYYEYIREVKGSNAMGDLHVIDMYRVTVYAEGQTTNSATILQSVYGTM
ncbi:MAG: hypothetical protein H0W44_03475 [Gammaproteobacteria bacterium]|nr:hypothetical protein [Gammaproteobacteria bacterium]